MRLHSSHFHTGGDLLLQKVHYTTNLTRGGIVKFVTHFKLTQINSKQLELLVNYVRLSQMIGNVNDTAARLVEALHVSSDQK